MAHGLQAYTDKGDEVVYTIAPFNLYKKILLRTDRDQTLVYDLPAPPGGGAFHVTMVPFTTSPDVTLGTSGASSCYLSNYSITGGRLSADMSYGGGVGTKKEWQLSIYVERS